mmetsp:Transcript_16136/g.23631  ORF Transcript_16136/g.23631 Transcript_16136/m.23631 type:complete len:218 (+) Transcript_16136:271-924(+)
MNGCICCTVRGDLVEALKRLRKRLATFKFDGVIIETTGLADPAPVAQTFFVDEVISEMYSLDSIITVADAKCILDRLHDEKPEGVENEAVEQVCFADKVLLNKTDLADEEKLAKIEKEIKALNPTTKILRCLHSKVDPKELLNIKAFELDRVLDFDPEFLDEEAEHMLACTMKLSHLYPAKSREMSTKSCSRTRYNVSSLKIVTISTGTRVSLPSRE